MKIRGKAKVNATEATEQVDEAKATYCGRCGTTHVAPKDGGKCPALKEGFQERDKRAFKRAEHEAEWKRDQEIERAKKKRDSQTHHLAINGKVWHKNGKPVEFNGRNHAIKTAQSMMKQDKHKDTKFHALHHTSVKDGKPTVKLGGK